MFPEGGGHFWVFLQWIRGFQRNGCDVWWLECLDQLYKRQPNSRIVETFLHNLDSVGLRDRALVYRPRDDGGIEFVNVESSRGLAILDEADLLVNFRYQVHSEVVGRARRSALIDIDPGLLQFWLSHDQLALASHDKYFTTGEHVGSQRVPDCGYPWIQIRPAVDTQSWTFDGPPSNDAFTTVTNWFGEWLTDGAGWLLDNSKRIEFLRIVDLPSRTDQPLELAVCLGTNDEDVADRELLVRNGWRVRHSFQVSRDPHAYREYIRTSRGEFSCVKPSCLLFQNAWISDRTLCYLASGRPAVVQHTGPSLYLPDGRGLFRFTTVDEAVAAFDVINSDYRYQCNAARQLAEEYFDAAGIASVVLEAALA
jgi:hypothetical protein